MPAGLQIMNASGNILLDTTSFIGRQTGAANIPTSGPTYTGTISVPGYASGATVWYVATFSGGTLGPPPGITGDFYDPTIISVSGGTISWEAYAGVGEVKLIYGVY